MNPIQLPSSPQLDIAALSRLFRHTTTSYKYLFFLALLRTLRDRNFSSKRLIPQRELLIEMLVLAITQEMMPKRKWSRLVEPFLADLRIAVMDDLFEPKRLSEAYQASLEPLFSLAANQGFPMNWRYLKRESQSS